MFDILLGTKFSSKCKHAIKCIATRILTIRRKKQAMVRFLRKDVADLIANGLEINAFGRIEALIVETNHASCYDMIQHYCDYIKGQLPTLQKRECPNVNEVLEAVATLIYAAARFSDLPELCDLRHLFTERYGTDMETSVSAEFVEKMQKKSFSASTKLRFMQEIAQEFSVTWDCRAFEQKMSTPAVFVSDQPRKGTPSSNQINKSLSMGTARKEADTEMLSEEIPHKGKFESAPRMDQPRKRTPAHNQINKPLPVSNVRKGTETEMPISNLPRDQPRKGTTRDQINEPLFESARKEADTRLLTAEVPCKGNLETTRSSNWQKQVQPEPRVVHVVSSINNDQTNSHYGRPRKGSANEPENVEPIRRNAAPLYSMKDSSNNAQHNESITHGRLPRVKEDDQARKVAGADRAASMVPPYTKPKGSMPESNAEELHANRYTYDVSARAAEGPINPRIQEKQPANRVSSSNGRPFSMMPPYVKPKTNILPANDDWSSGGEFKHHLQDALPDEEKPETLSVRRRRTKPQVFSEIETTIDDNNLVSRTPSGRRRHGEQQSYDEEYNEGEKRRDQDPKLAVWDEMPVDPTPSDRRRHGSRRSTDGVYDKYCDEEVVMDQLLMHYSTKDTDNKPGKARTRARAPPREVVLDSGKVLEQQSDAKFRHRVASLPKEPVRLAEAVRGPARAASMQPEILSPGRRCAYPKPPKYDNLTAQSRALRGA